MHKERQSNLFALRERHAVLFVNDVSRILLRTYSNEYWRHFLKSFLWYFYIGQIFADFLSGF